MIGQYINTVKPMHEQFVEPSKRNASIIVPEGGEPVALQMLLSQVRSHLPGGRLTGAGEGGRKPARLQSSEWLHFATILPEFCGRNLKIKKEECGILFLYRN